MANRIPSNFSSGDILTAAQVNQMLAERTDDILPIDNTSRDYLTKTHDLGSATYQYKYAHISDAIYSEGVATIEFDASNNVTIGNGSLTVSAGNIKTAANTDMVLDAGSGDLILTGSAPQFKFLDTGVAATIYAQIDCNSAGGGMTINTDPGNLGASTSFSVNVDGTQGLSIDSNQDVTIANGDLVVGDTADTGTAKATILSHSSDDGRLLFGDEANAGIGGLIYSHTSDRLALVAGGEWSCHLNGTGQLLLNGGSGGQYLQRLNLYENSSNGIAALFINSTTGITAGNGFLIGIDASEKARFTNYENTDMYFDTNSATRLTIAAGGDITATGNVTIGTAGDTGDAVLNLLAHNSDDCRINFGDEADADIGYLNYDHTHDKLSIAVGTTIEMSIDSDGIATTNKIQATGGIEAGTSTETLKYKKIDIGVWNMDTTAQLVANHGLGAAWEKIQFISGMICDDSELIWDPFISNSSFADGGVSNITSTQFTLKRTQSGASYNSTAISRGYISVWYAA